MNHPQDIRKRAMYSLRLGPSFGVKPVTDMNFYLRLTLWKRRVFAFFTEKYLRSGYSSINFTTSVNFRNPKTEIQSKIVKMNIIETQT